MMINENFDCKEVKKNLPKVSTRSNLSFIYDSLLNRDVGVILDFIEEVALKKELVFDHPEIVGLETKAFYSIQPEMQPSRYNLIFFADSAGENIWIIGQNNNFIDFIATENNIYSPFHYNHTGQKKIFIKTLFSIDADKIGSLFSESSGQVKGFKVRHDRPYHFYYDLLKTCLYLHQKKVDIKYYLDKPFYWPKSWESHQYKSNGLYVLPVGIGHNYIVNHDKDWGKEWGRKLEDFIKKDSFQLAVGSKNKKNEIILWLGVTGQKRSWLQQLEGYTCIVKYLSIFFDSVKVFVDGMTAKEGGKISNEEDELIYNELRERLSSSKNVILFSMIGIDYRSKIELCEQVDIAITNAGTGSFVPSRICKKPTIMHRGKSLKTFYFDVLPTDVYVPDYYVLDELSKYSSEPSNRSYHTSWKVLLNYLLEKINAEKEINIPLLSISNPVDEFEFGEKEYLDKLDLSSQGKNNFEVLRDLALVMERLNEYNAALVLMKKARVLNPGGPLINKKISYYENLLSSE